MSKNNTKPATLQEANAEIERLRALVQKQNTLTLKVSSKGAVSLYGLQRFPVTLYREQWERVIEHANAIRAFIAENAEALTTKG